MSALFRPSLLITSKEYILSENDVVMSFTDLQSYTADTNGSFISASDFSADDLIARSAPHDGESSSDCHFPLTESSYSPVNMTYSSW